MNVEIIIDDSYDELTIKIYGKEYSKDMELVKEKILGNLKEKISGFRNDEVKIIDYKEIIRFYTESNKTLFDSTKGTYTTRLRLYELEERLPNNKFIKISRSEIVNLDYVDRLDLSFTGTIAIEMKDKKVSYVSRRNLKNFKKALGL